MVLRPTLSLSLLLLAPLAAQPVPLLRLHEGPGRPVHDAEGLRQAAEVIERLVVADELLGAVVVVAQGRVVLLDEAYGHRDVARTQPMRPDTLFRMASNTKAVTAAAVLALVDDGKLALNDPVARFLPGFRHGKSVQITVHQLLTHTSGLRIPTLFVQPLMTASDEHPDAPNLVLEASRFGEIGPAVEPGTSYAYSNPGYNALAALVEVVAEQPFAEFVQRRFYRPLAMKASCHHETVADNARMCEVVHKGDDGAWVASWRPGDPPTVPFVRGSGGMISTANDFVCFCRLWLDDGMAGERRLLSEARVRQATTDRIAHLERGHYGYGWIAEGDGVFSHGGSDGTWAWCDRSRDLVGLVFTQTQGHKALDEARMRCRELVAAAVPVR